MIMAHGYGSHRLSDLIALSHSACDILSKSKCVVYLFLRMGEGGWGDEGGGYVYLSEFHIFFFNYERDT